MKGTVIERESVYTDPSSLATSYLYELKLEDGRTYTFHAPIRFKEGHEVDVEIGEEKARLTQFEGLEFRL